MPTSDMNPISKPTTNKEVAGSMFDTSGLRKPKTEMGKDDFLKLLVAQMANQDPMNTMNDTEFIAQMAQFSALEQMQALNDSYATTQAQNMIGKNVMATTYIKNEQTGNYDKVELYGTVTGTVVVQGKTYIQVGEYLLEPSQVSGVYDTSNFENGMMNGSNMIGKYIKATIPAEKQGESDRTVMGQVEQIISKNGHFYAKVGDDEILLSYVKIVSDKPIAATTAPENTENSGEGQ